MKYAKNILLKLPLSADANLRAFVEKAILDRVDLIAIFGESARQVEDELDWLIVEMAGAEDQWIVTTAHTPDDDETELCALEFAKNWQGRGYADVVSL